MLDRLPIIGPNQDARFRGTAADNVCGSTSGSAALNLRRVLARGPHRHLAEPTAVSPVGHAVLNGGGSSGVSTGPASLRSSSKNE